MSLAEGYHLRDHSHDDDGVVLGDDFVAPDNVVEEEVRIRRARRGYISRGSGGSLTRKIITFNLIALNVLVAGILYLSASRDGLAQQRADSLHADVELIADVFEAQAGIAQDSLNFAIDAALVERTLQGLDIQRGNEVFVFDADTKLTGRAEGTVVLVGNRVAENSPTVITDALNRFWETLSAPFSGVLQADRLLSLEDQARALIDDAMGGQTTTNRGETGGVTVFTVATPIVHNGSPIGVVALANAS
ncbi:MAG: sensor N-terminal transmembrane domain-containing protein, partial [Pseudomonadota bacterium]